MTAFFHEDVAAALGKTYDKAAEVMDRLRTHVNSGAGVELPNLGSFKTGRLSAWDQQGWVFVADGPAEKLGPQQLPWKQITAEHLVRLAQAIHGDAANSPEDQYGLGALAFAAAALDVAAEHLAQAAREPALAPLVAVPLRLLKKD